MSSARSGLCRNAAETTFGTQVARPGGSALVDGAETQLNRASAAVDLTVW